MSTTHDYSDAWSDNVDEHRLARNLAGARQWQLRRRLRRATIRGAASTIAMVGLLYLAIPWLIAVTKGETPPPIGVAPTKARPFSTLGTAGRARPDEIPLDDGSTLIVGPDSHLQVVENTGTHFTTTLERGWARFSVKPGGPRRWTVEAGLLRVEVLGTSFTVGRRADAVTVRVHRGHVSVRGEHVPGYTRDLRAPQTLVVRAPTPQTATAGNLVEVGDNNRPAEATTPVGQQDQVAAQGNPVPLVASDTAPAAGPKKLTMHEVLALADAAREDGRGHEAESLLSDFLVEHPHADGVGVLALTLGRLRLDVLGRPQEAAEALAFAVDSPSLPVRLREQALARRIQALAATDDASSARSEAQLYRKQYPKGSWRTRVDSWSPPP